MWNNTENKCINHLHDNKEEILKLALEDQINIAVDEIYDTPGVTIEDRDRAIKFIYEQPHKWPKLAKMFVGGYGNQ